MSDYLVQTRDVDLVVAGTGIAGLVAATVARSRRLQPEAIDNRTNSRGRPRS